MFIYLLFIYFWDAQLTVNEAAAQLCVKDNALLTRRDELFALARQVSREVTYKYTYRTTRYVGDGALAHWVGTESETLFMVNI